MLSRLLQLRNIKHKLGFSEFVRRKPLGTL